MKASLSSDNLVKYFVSRVRRNPKDIAAWLGLAEVLDDPAKKRDCYLQVLKIAPSHPIATQKLADLEKEGRKGLRPGVLQERLAESESNTRPRQVQPYNVRVHPASVQNVGKKKSCGSYVVLALVIFFLLSTLGECVSALQGRSSHEIPTANPQEQAAIEAVKNYTTDVGTIVEGIGIAAVLMESYGHTYRPGGWYVKQEPGHYVVTYTFYMDGKREEAVWWYVPFSQMVVPKNEWARTFMGE